MDARDIIAHTMNRDIPENIHEDIRGPRRSPQIRPMVVTPKPANGKRSQDKP
jgi:hypothetical protein